MNVLLEIVFDRSPFVCSTSAVNRCCLAREKECQSPIYVLPTHKLPITVARFRAVPARKVLTATFMSLITRHIFRPELDTSSSFSHSPKQSALIFKIHYICSLCISNNEQTVRDRNFVVTK